MGIVIDIIILLLVLVSTYLGYRKGLVSLAVSFIAFIAAIVITILLYKPIGNLIINTTTIDEKLQATIQDNIENIVATDVEENKITGELIASVKEGALPSVSLSIAVNVIYGITMILLFVIARIVLILINLLADAISKLPILNQFNKAGGILYGLLRGLIIAYLILMIMSLITVFNSDGVVSDVMQESYFVKAMNEHNLLNVF